MEGTAEISNCVTEDSAVAAVVTDDLTAFSTLVSAVAELLLESLLELVLLPHWIKQVARMMVAMKGVIIAKICNELQISCADTAY